MSFKVIMERLLDGVHVSIDERYSASSRSRSFHVSETKLGDLARRQRAWSEISEVVAAARFPHVVERRSFHSAYRSGGRRLMDRLEHMYQLEVVSQDARSRSQIADQDPPPAWITFCLSISLPAKNRPNVLGDLEEEYREYLWRFGRRGANFWYASQAVRSSVSLAGPAMRALLLKWLVEIAKRIVS